MKYKNKRIMKYKIKKGTMKYTSKNSKNDLLKQAIKQSFQVKRYARVDKEVSVKFVIELMKLGFRV